MIFYFSGTGNSRYVAKRLERAIGEDLLFIPDISADTMKDPKGSSLGFVFPIYSWGVPPLVLELIEKLPESFVSALKQRQLPIWMVCTCGDETGKAPEMLEKALARRGLELKGIWSVQMPNNYVLLPGFDVDNKKVEHQKLDDAPERIDHIAKEIGAGNWQRDFVAGPHAALKTAVVYPLFRKWGINTSKWHWTQECVKCGRCAAVCPMDNIKLVNDHPKWGKNCVSCLACYHICPGHAIEYGHATQKKGQYFLKSRK